MEIASCSSSVYALPHSNARTRPRRERGLISGFWGSSQSRTTGFVITVLRKPWSHEKTAGAICRRNVHTDGHELHTDDMNKSNLAILLEVEGILADFNISGNRDAFNVAFQKLGLDCANWTSPIYRDLVRKASGVEERMLVLFFNRIGWPTSLPTNEKESFLKNVMREKRHAMEDYAITNNIYLRPGIEKFIDDAIEAGIPVIILSSYSKHGEEVARHIIGKLGSGRISEIKIVGRAEVEKSFYGQLVLGKGVSAGMDELLANEAAKAIAAEKLKVAEEVASMLNLSVEVDTTSNETLKMVVAALRAGAEYAGRAIDNCILLSGSRIGVCAADRVGMPCIVIRSSSTSRAEFPSAIAVMEGFGVGDLTVSRIRKMTGC